jgi:hypothetical protein
MVRLRPVVSVSSAFRSSCVRHTRPGTICMRRLGLLRGLDAPKMTYPLVRDLAAENVPVRLACGVARLRPRPTS